MIIAASSTPSVGESLFTHFDHTEGVFDRAVHGGPGSVFVSDLSNVSEPVRHAAAEGRLSNRLLNLLMLAPVLDASNRCVGILVANVATRQLLDLLQDLRKRAPGGEFPCLLDKSGLVLMSTDPKACLLIMHADVTSGALLGPVENRLEGYLVYKDFRGHKLMAGYTTLRTYDLKQAGDWRLITLASYDAIMKPVTETFNRMLAVLVVTVAGAVGFGLWLARRLAEPVLKLTESAKTIAAGHFGARVVVNSRDERACWVTPSTRWPVPWRRTAMRCKRKLPNAPGPKRR